MINKVNFEDFFQNKIEHKIEKLNSTRKIIAPIVAILRVFFFAGPILVILFVVYLDLFPESPWLGGLLASPFVIGTAFLTMLAYGLVTSKYRFSYKDGIVVNALAEMGSQCEYKQNQGLPEKFFHSSLLFAHYPSPGGYASEDLFILENEGNSIAFAEIHSSCGGKYTRRTIFDGLLGFMPVGTQFMNPIILRSRLLDKTATEGAVLTPTFEKLAKRLGVFKQVEFNEEEFDYQFDVYAVNSKKTKELLNPKIRTKILNIQKKFRSNLHFSFINGLLYIAFPGNRDLFDPPIFETIDKQWIYNDFKLVDAMVNLIDIFDIELSEEEKKSPKELMRIINSYSH